MARNLRHERCELFEPIEHDGQRVIELLREAADQLPDVDTVTRRRDRP